MHHSNSKNAKEVINAAIKEGINYIDTSPWYRRSEALLGEVLPHISRNKYVISSKCGRKFSDDILEWFDFSYDSIRDSINMSIQKLGCKYLDICFCHDIEFAPTVEILLSESLPAMQEAKNSGKIKYIGLSGYPLEKLKQIIELTDVKIDVVLTYCRYTLNDRSLLDSLSFFEEHDVAVINASPFAMGLLTDAGPPSWHSATPETKAAAAEAAEYCRDQGTDLTRLALYFSTSNPQIPTTLVGCQTLEELRANIDVLKNGLNQEELMLMTTVKEKFFPENHSWEGIGEDKYWAKVKKEMEKASNLFWKMQNATTVKTPFN